MRTDVDTLLHDPDQRPARHAPGALHQRIMASLDDAPPSREPRMIVPVLAACVLIGAIALIVAIALNRPRPIETTPALPRARSVPTLPSLPQDLQVQVVHLDRRLTDPYRIEAERLAADARRTVAQLTSRMPSF